MKTYKLNNIEISEESAREFIKNNPELLEKKVSGRYFFPKFNEVFYYINSKGGVVQSTSFQTTRNSERILMGVYRTKEEAELARDKQQAIVRCWKWQQENAPFEPDWEDEGQNKHGVFYDYEFKKIKTKCCTTWEFDLTLPYFKSAEDRDNFIEANKEDLLLLFTK